MNILPCKNVKERCAVCQYEGEGKYCLGIVLYGLIKVITKIKCLFSRITRKIIFNFKYHILGDKDIPF